MSSLNTALVTGGGRGIGKETAILLSKPGFIIAPIVQMYFLFFLEYYLSEKIRTRFLGEEILFFISIKSARDMGLSLGE
jgi:hypothetical protein